MIDAISLKCENAIIIEQYRIRQKVLMKMCEK